MVHPAGPDLLALQVSVPPAVVHDQFHGPLPVMLLALPLLHRPLDGAEAKLPPFALPHWPGAGGAVLLAEQVSVPVDVTHVQDQGPLPERALALPEAQRLLDGALG